MAVLYGMVSKSNHCKRREVRRVNRIYLTIELEALTQLHIGSGEEKRLLDSSFLRTVNGSIMIPGTSLGGVLRARAAQIFLGGKVLHGLQSGSERLLFMPSMPAVWSDKPRC